MDSKSVLNWIFTIDTLNFCFWSPSAENLFTVEYEGSRYDGYMSLVVAINRALAEGIPITTAEYQRDLTREKLQHIFRSCNGTQVPLLEERLQVLKVSFPNETQSNQQEAGTVLCDKFHGSFMNCVEQSNHSCMTLLKMVVTHFDSYKDEHTFQGQAGSHTSLQRS